MLKTFGIPITQFDGKPVTDQTGAEVTVAQIVVRALGLDDATASPEEKLRRFLLAERIYNAGKAPVEVIIEELKTIKECVGKGQPFIVGFIYRHLES
jgi:hypothetical protein